MVLVLVRLLQFLWYCMILLRGFFLFFLQLPRYSASTKPAPSLRKQEERRNKKESEKGRKRRKRYQAHTPPHSISYIKPAAADLDNII